MPGFQSAIREIHERELPAQNLQSLGNGGSWIGYPLQLDALLGSDLWCRDRDNGLDPISGTKW